MVSVADSKKKKGKIEKGKKLLKPVWRSQTMRKVTGTLPAPWIDRCNTLKATKEMGCMVMIQL
jgi:hypothetical protein